MEEIFQDTRPPIVRERDQLRVLLAEVLTGIPTLMEWPGLQGSRVRMWTDKFQSISQVDATRIVEITES